MNKKINALIHEKNKLEINIKDLEEEQYDKLYCALSTHLIKTRLYEVEGIGPKLRDAIIREYTNGTLDSLRFVSERIQGIGEQKQRAIFDWASKLKSQLPDMLKQDFPNKENIIEIYGPKINGLKKQYNKVKERLSHFYEIRKIALSEKNRLSKVRVSHFIKAYKNKKEASLLVNEHIKGVFPEWSSIPDWFKILISEGVV